MRLAIYGTGGLGKDVFIISQCITHEEKKWSDIFFIDDFDFDRRFKGAEVRSFEETLKARADLSVVIAVGEPEARAALFRKVQAHGLPVATLIHPKNNIPDCAKIGNGVVLCEHVTVSGDVIIEDNACVQHFVQISHDCKIGRNAVLAAHASLAGRCVIGDQAYIGMGALVREGTIIGDNSVVGMGSVVLQDISKGVVAVGNPAKVIRKSDEKKIFR